MKTYTFHEYFYYTRLERNAGIALCALCILTWALPFAFPSFTNAPPLLDFSDSKFAAARFATEVASIDEAASTQPTFRGYENESPRKAELFPFDPNTASKTDFERLGFSSRTAQTILNYRAKGGHFYKKEDLKRIYTVRPEDYARLEPYIQVSPKPNSDNHDYATKYPDNQGIATQTAYEGKPFAPQNFTKKNASAIVDINTASAEDWQQIRGIGPGWAKRITNYREKLGGFTAPQQVAETFGLPDSVFQAVLPQLQLSSGIFRKIKLNAATLDELKAHPYLNSFQATILFNYRMQHGNFTDLTSVKKVKAGFKEEDWKRLEPYFSFE